MPCPQCFNAQIADLISNFLNDSTGVQGLYLNRDIKEKEQKLKIYKVMSYGLLSTLRRKTCQILGLVIIPRQHFLTDTFPSHS